MVSIAFYAILRSIPDKLGGVLAMGAAILIMLTIPFTNSSEIRSSYFRPIYTKIFWIFAADCVILMGLDRMLLSLHILRLVKLRQ